jgi:outer membrane protein assembly factor BamB
LWDTVVPGGKYRVSNFYHGYAVPTPATDGKRIFALFASGVLTCLDINGKIVWRKELPHENDEYGGICASPILLEDTVIIESLADTALRALEKNTGKVRWEQKTRPRNSMSTPTLIRVNNRPQLIRYAGTVQSLNPKTGELLWFCQGVTSSQSSPVFADGLLYTDAGRYNKNCTGNRGGVP